MKKIAIFVLLVHFFIVLWIASFEKISFHPLPEKLTVKQYIAKTPPPAKPKIKTAPPSSQAPKKKPPSPPPPPPLKKSQPPPKPQTEKPKQSPLTQKLVRELEESIVKIEGKHDKVDTSPKLKAESSIDALKIDSLPQSNTLEKYTETLIFCLRESLNLPDYGEVKIKLTLWQDGSVKQLDVLKAESENNQRYLETHLPHVKFPALNKPEHTFVLTFCNEA